MGIESQRWYNNHSPQSKLLSTAPVPANVQWELLDLYSHALAHNPHLDTQVWRHLCTQVFDTDPPNALFGRELSRDDLTWLLGQKLPVDARCGALEANLDIVDDDVIEATKLSVRIAGLLASAPNVSMTSRLNVAEKATLRTRLDVLYEHIGDPEVDERIRGLVTTSTDWWPKRGGYAASRDIAAMVEFIDGLYDHLLANADKLEPRLVTTLAGSHKLRPRHHDQVIALIAGLGSDSRYAEMAFCANPMVPIETAQSVATPGEDTDHIVRRRVTNRAGRHIQGAVADCGDVELLSWVVQRATPMTLHNGDTKPGKPWLLGEVVEAPAFKALGERTQRDTLDVVRVSFPQRVAERLLADHGGIDDYDSVPHQEPIGSRPTNVDLSQLHVGWIDRAGAVEQVADRLGDDPSKWRFVAEMINGYDGTVEELLVLAEFAA